MRNSAFGWRLQATRSFLVPPFSTLRKWISLSWVVATLACGPRITSCARTPVYVLPFLKKNCRLWSFRPQRRLVLFPFPRHPCRASGTLWRASRTSCSARNVRFRRRSRPHLCGRRDRRRFPKGRHPQPRPWRSSGSSDSCFLFRLRFSGYRPSLPALKRRRLPRPRESYQYPRGPLYSGRSKSPSG
jgi:hypothetical protein